jgi:TPP-dependent trihydroxycyclohexane-1,2-dione (THcHDO) dehydratase
MSPLQVLTMTAAQAVVRYLCAQSIEFDGHRQPLFAGVWAIFGHGNVAEQERGRMVGKQKRARWSLVSVNSLEV